jgi:hypothetical protein
LICLRPGLWQAIHLFGKILLRPNQIPRHGGFATMTQTNIYASDLTQSAKTASAQNAESEKIKNDIEEVDISKIKELLIFLGLFLGQVGKYGLNHFLQYTAFIDDFFNFKKVTKKRKDGILMRWQNITKNDTNKKNKDAQSTKKTKCNKFH